MSACEFKCNWYRWFYHYILLYSCSAVEGKIQDVPKDTPNRLLHLECFWRAGALIYKHEQHTIHNWVQNFLPCEYNIILLAVCFKYIFCNLLFSNDLSGRKCWYIQAVSSQSHCTLPYTPNNKEMMLLIIAFTVNHTPPGTLVSLHMASTSYLLVGLGTSAWVEVSSNCMPRGESGLTRGH